MNDIGEKIRNLRKELGMTQRELAGRTLSKSLISQIENNLVNPPLSTLSIVAHRLNRPISYFYPDTTRDHPQFADCLRTLTAHMEAGRWELAREVGVSALRWATTTATTETIVKIRSRLGQVLFKAGQLCDALECLDDAYEDALRLNDATLMAEILLAQGNCHYAASQFQEAYRKYKRSADKSRDLKRAAPLHARSTLFLASSAYRLGDLKTSRAAFQSLYDAAHPTLQAQLRVDAGIGLTWLKHECGETAAAIALAEEIKGLCTRQRTRGLAAIKCNLGIFLVRQGQRQRGLDYLRGAYDAFRERDEIVQLVSAGEEIAADHLHCNDFNQALSEAWSCLKFLDTAIRLVPRGRVYRLLGHIHTAMGDGVTARQWYELAMAAFTQCDAQREQDQTAQYLA